MYRNYNYYFVLQTVNRGLFARDKLNQSKTINLSCLVLPYVFRCPNGQTTTLVIV